MIGIVDYNAGNITSVARSLEKLGIDYVLSKTPSDLSDCDKLIFPGVGDAAYAMKQLKQTGFDVFLKKWAADGKAILGICLGSQIIFDFSEEGDTECLGLIKGRIRHFDNLIDMPTRTGDAPRPNEKENLVDDVESNSSDKEIKIPHMGSVASSDLTEFRIAKLEQANTYLKVPHMGWNNLTYKNGGTFLLDCVPENSDFYFVHSYVICPDESTVIKATSDYGIEVPAIVQSGNVMACQFHPEKSGAVGLQILKNFCNAPNSMFENVNKSSAGDVMLGKANKSGEV